MYVPPCNNPEYSQWRLDRILSRRRLTFNPYTVTDERLMEIVTTTGWGNIYDIVQITTVTFTRLREASKFWEFDGIYMRTATNPEEIFFHCAALMKPITANDSLQQVRCWVGKRPIYTDKDVANLVGKTYFVSRIINGTNRFGNIKAAYRFHRIKGNIAKDAAMIREAMCAAKIEMLERILAYPSAPDHLSCDKNFINYEPRIRRAIEIIRRYPETPVPQD